MQSIILGGGCFWCTESVFRQVRGISQVTSGYAGGDADTANYKAVCGGDTGHIEVIKVQFDDAIISLQTILDIFFTIHDPTTQDRQGNDVGRQYASVVFYADDEQKAVVNHTIAKLKEDGIAIVTEVYPAPTFYPAEEYHQDFFSKNPSQGYCNLVIPPKLAKLRGHYAQWLA